MKRLVNLVCLISMVYIMQCFCGQLAEGSPLSNSTRNHQDASTEPLLNLGQIALKLVEHLTQAEDENVDINQLSDFVTALAEATVTIKHPEIPKLENALDEMELLRKQFTEDTEEFRNANTELEGQLKATKEVVSTLHSQLNQTRAELREFKTQAETMETPLVAFTASATTSQSFTSSTVVKFDKPNMNYGNHYDSATGIFTCPITGLYSVSVKLDEYSNKGLDLEVVVDGMRIMYLKKQASSNYASYMSLSGSTLTQCQSGNRIWVRSNGSGQIAGNNEANVFSVFLVSKLDE